MITSRRASIHLITTGLVLAIAGSPAAIGEIRGPQPGEVYREFSLKMTGSAWRITDPNATHPGSPGNSPADFLPNPIVTMDLPNDAMSGAVRAEAVIDAWGGHIGTTGLQMRMNGNAWLDIPYPTVTEPPAEAPLKDAECYMHQWNPVVTVPLGHLRGGANTLQGNAGPQTCYSFNWGQWGWYAVTLRVYYNPTSVAHPSGTIVSPAAGATIGDYPTVQTVVASTRPIDRIDFLAYYDGYDTDGDGDSTEFHHSYHLTPGNQQPGIREHVGTAVGGRTSVDWDTTFVPDQAPGGIRLIARVCDDAGTCTVTPEVRDITLERSGTSSLLFQPSEVPPRYWVRNNQTKSSNVFIPSDVDLGSATEAYMLVRTWNGVSGHAEPGEDHWRKINGHTIAPFGANHRYSYNHVPVPVDVLRNGDNTITFHAQTVHHGIEIQWPGPALFVRFSDDQPTCGDGVVGSGEECDAAGNASTCDADCTFVECGDGLWNAAAGEQCDDGNSNGNDLCSNDCTLPAGPNCGNGTVDAGEDCDSAGVSAACDLDCSFPECGDGFLNTSAGEQCDDGNTADGDSCNSECQLPPTNSLPAFYGFEGGGSTVTDDSPSQNDGTLIGAVRDPNGRFGSAVRFDGSSERVDLGFLDVGGGRLTVGAWFRADDFGTSDGRILSKTTSPDDQDHYLMLSTLSSSGAMRLRFRLKTVDGTTHTLIGENATIQAGVWTHVAASYDGLTMRLYKNGTLIGSRVAGGAIAVDPTVRMTLGDNPDGSRPFDGLIDEVRLDSRTLTRAQIEAWMNTPVVASSGCVSDGECDDGLFCNGNETCEGGECRPGDAVVCRDTLGCTTDQCNEDTDSCESVPDHDFCDDGIFCNGSEECHPIVGCRSGAPVDCDDQVFCTTDTCNEGADRCEHAIVHSACDDGEYCNGEERCDLLGGCTTGTPPCAGSECDDASDACAECLTDAHCDDGDFCNGLETCADGSCLSGSDPCTGIGESCNELQDTCDVNPVARLETVQQTVGSIPQRVFLQNDYIKPVIACTVHYGNNVEPVVPRLSAVTGGGFDLRLQNPSDGPVFDDRVNCLVAEQGVWNVDGLRFEATRFRSTRTDGANAWIGQPRSYRQAYEAPVVIGQVMTSANDTWSAFWARGEAPTTPPSPSVLRVGKAIGQDPNGDRRHETLGYFVFESGNGTLGGVDYIVGVGSDTIVGYDNGERMYELTPAMTTASSAAPGAGAFAIASVAGMDGNDGGWANVTGVSASELRLFVDEDQTMDAERSHTSEQIGYLALAGPVVYPAEPQCAGDADCDNGLFCDGPEVCNDGICSSVGNPCGDLFCDEATASCLSCLDDFDCDDGNFCNGAEVCSAGACASGPDPCGSDACDEQADVCAECFIDDDCKDGSCVDGSCVIECDGDLPYFTTFDGAVQPEGWFDTAADNSMAPADGFKRRVVLDQYAFGTGSTATNIHSHYVSDTSHTWSDYSLEGRMRMGGTNSGIGVTVLSDFPRSDRYYRLRRWQDGPAFGLSAHGTGLQCDVLNTGVTPVSNRWYRFEVRVDDEGAQTRVRARVWIEGDAQPDWQQNCVDRNFRRLKEGTVGVWSMGPQFKYWDDIEVTCNAN